MVAPIRANKKVALGRTTWWAVPTVSTSTAPTAAEVNSASGLNLVGFVLGDQEGVSSDTGKTQLPRLLMETITTDVLEPTTYSLPTLRCVWDPQAAAGANDKKAWALFGAGFTGYLIQRMNVVNSVSDAGVAGQFVDVIPVISSVGVPKESSNGADGIYVFDVDFGVTGVPSFNVAIV